MQAHTKAKAKTMSPCKVAREKGEAKAKTIPWSSASVALFGEGKKIGSTSVSSFSSFGACPKKFYMGDFSPITHFCKMV